MTHARANSCTTKRGLTESNRHLLGGLREEGGRQPRQLGAVVDELREGRRRVHHIVAEGGGQVGQLQRDVVEAIQLRTLCMAKAYLGTHQARRCSRRLTTANIDAI